MAAERTEQSDFMDTSRSRSGFRWWRVAPACPLALLDPVAREFFHDNQGSRLSNGSIRRGKRTAGRPHCPVDFLRPAALYFPGVGESPREAIRPKAKP